MTFTRPLECEIRSHTLYKSYFTSHKFKSLCTSIKLSRIKRNKVITTMLSLLSVSPMEAELSPISVDCLARELEGCCLVLLVDIRPSSQHCSSHIQSSENINFTNILLRRLTKGVVKLNTHVSNQELVEKLTQRDPSCTKLVLYDNTSKKGCIKSELTKHAEVLYKTCSQSTSTQVYYLDGESSLHIYCVGTI